MRIPITKCFGLRTYDVSTVIPGRACSREPGIHHRDTKWIPGLRQEAHPGMTGRAIAALAITIVGVGVGGCAEI